MSQTLQRHHGRTTPFGRRRALLVAVLALFLAATAFAAPRHLLKNGEDRSYLSTDGWPLFADRGRTCSATAGRR